MKTNVIKGILIFALGGGIGFLVAKKMYEDFYADLAQEEIDSVKEMYRKREVELVEHIESSVNDIRQTYENGMTEEEYGDRAEESLPKWNEQKNSLVRPSVPANDKMSKVAYHDLAKDKMKGALGIKDISSIQRHNVFDDCRNEPVTDEAGYSEGEVEDCDTIRDLSEIDRTEPYSISGREYSDEFPHHDKVSLYYYTYDDVLCDENQEKIDDIDETVGWDCFKTLEMQTTAWVRNEPLSIDYEICAVRASYSQQVLGVPAKVLSPREQHLRQLKRRDNVEE